MYTLGMCWKIQRAGLRRKMRETNNLKNLNEDIYSGYVVNNVRYLCGKCFHHILFVFYCKMLSEIFGNGGSFFFRILCFKFVKNFSALYY